MLEPKYFTPTETTAELRKALKAAFPGKKISVRTDKYAGGASIDVYWIDGPAETEIKKIAERFEGADFNPIEDIKEYRTSNHNGETVQWGADFVCCERSYTPEALKAVMEKIGVTEMAFVSPTGMAYLDPLYTDNDRRRQINAAAAKTSF